MSGQGRLSGQVAIVTGAAGGLGEAIAKTLAREGASVAVTDINIQDAKRVESEIQKSGGSSLAVQFDVTQSRQVTGMVQQVLDRWGAIDILVNNAGGFTSFSSLLEITEEAMGSGRGLESEKRLPLLSGCITTHDGKTKGKNCQYCVESGTGSQPWRAGLPPLWGCQGRGDGARPAAGKRTRTLRDYGQLDFSKHGPHGAHH